MFSPNPKNDPLLAAIKGVIAENDKHREAVDRANKHFKITDKRQLPHNLHADYDKMLSESTIISEKITKSTPMGDVIRDFEKSDAPQFEGKSKEKRRQMAIAAKMAMNEALKGDQHKIDANKNNRIDAQDFKMLRKMDEDVMLEAITNLLQKDTLSESEYNIIMESAFGKAFKAARASGKSEFEFNGKMYNSRQADETEDQWKSNLAKSAPVPLPRPADRMPTGTTFDPTDPLRGTEGIEVGPAVNNTQQNMPTQVTRPPLGGRDRDFVPRIEFRKGVNEESQYSVKKGDTLSAIAKRNNTTVDAIVKSSGISDPNKLSIGQKIVIPGKMVAPVPLPRPDSRRPTQQEPASVTMRPSATSTSGIGANVNTGVRQPMAAMRPSATSTSGNGAEVRPSVQDPRQKQMDAVLNNTSFSGNNTSLDNPLAGALASRYSDARPAIDPSDKADQDQQLADRLAQADTDQPKTTVDQYVKGLPSPELKTSVGLENWLNKMRR